MVVPRFNNVIKLGFFPSFPLPSSVSYYVPSLFSMDTAAPNFMFLHNVS